MKIYSFTELRKNLAAALDDVADNEEEVLIPRGNGRGVIMVPFSEWNSLRETLSVLGTRENTRRLLDSLDAADRGEFVEHTQPEVGDNRNIA